MSVINRDSLEKLTVSHLSWSHTVIVTDTDQSATYDFLLVIHSNHGPISYCFQDKWQFPSKITKFSHSYVFNAPADGTPRNLITEETLRETSVMLLAYGGKFGNTCNLFRYNTRVSQTDIQTDLL